MKDTIKLLNENGEEIEAEVLLYFSLTRTGNNYILYTFKEIDDKKMETIHASLVKQTAEGYKLDTMPDEDWEEVKEVMRNVIRSAQ